MKYSLDLIKNYIGIFGVVLLITGLLFSPFLLSISFAFILIQAFMDHRPSDIWRAMLQNKLSVLFVLLFIWYGCGIFYTSDISSFFDDLLMKLPLLIVPIAITSDKFTQKKQVVLFLLLLQMLVFVVGLASFINYILHKEEFDQLIYAAKPIPVVSGINHIYYSVLLSFSVISSVVLFLDRELKRYLNIVNLILFAGGLLFLHTISARTGLFAFYAGIMVILIWKAYASRKYLLTSLVLIAVVTGGLLSVRYVGVLHKRWQKTMEDINVYKEGGNINHYSLSMRIEYWNNTLKVFKKSPVWGVGNGDVEKVSALIYDEEQSVLLPENRKNAHNQFLQVLAGTGLIGFLLLISIFLLSFYGAVKANDLMTASLLTILFCAFLFESFLERQVGMAFFAFFLPFLGRSKGQHS